MRISNQMLIDGEMATRRISKKAHNFISESDPYKIAVGHEIVSDDPREIRDDYYVSSLGSPWVLVGHSLSELDDFVLNDAKDVEDNSVVIESFEDIDDMSTDELFDLAREIDCETLLNAIIKWLPDDEAHSMLVDICKDYDLDYK